MNDLTEYPATVKYNDEIVGYADKNGIVTFFDKNFAYSIMTQTPVYMSSRAFAHIDDDRIFDTATIENVILEKDIKK